MANIIQFHVVLLYLVCGKNWNKIQREFNKHSLIKKKSVRIVFISINLIFLHFAKALHAFHDWHEFFFLPLSSL